MTNDPRPGAEEFFTAMMSGSPDLISISLLEDGTYLSVNEAFLAVTGFSAEEVIGRTSTELGVWVNAEGRAGFRDLLFRDGRVTGLEVAFRLKCGEIRSFQLSAAVVEIGDRKCVTTVLRDLTGRNTMVEDLKKSQFLLERAEEMADIGSWEFDYASGMVTASAGAYRIYGIRLGEFTVKEIESVPLPEYRDMMNKARDEHIRLGRPYDIEFRIARKNDGALRWIRSKARWDGAKKRLFGIIRDVTEEKEAEERIRELNRELENKVAERTAELSASNAGLSAALEGLKRTQGDLVLSEKFAVLGQLASGIAHELNTPLGAIVSANRVVTRFLTEGFSEVLSFLLRLPEAQRRLYAACVDKGVTKPAGPAEGRSQHERRKEVERRLAGMGAAFPEEAADFLVELDLEHLVTELPELFADPLCLELLGHAGEEVTARLMADVVTVAAEKAAVVVRALRQHIGPSSADEAEAEDVDVDASLETVLTLLNNKIKYGVRVERHYGGARVRGSSHELGQLWMNLVNNAVQAMEYKGTLALETSVAGGIVTVKVTDSGPGIPEAVRSRIFEPFFSTKKHGEGMGLGLDIARKIAEGHGGRIAFESQPGRTCFTVSLPAAVRE